MPRYAALLAGALSLALSACAGLTGAPTPPASGYPAKPERIVVRLFAVPEGVVTLDPTLGFSLYRGHPGAPRAERAASVGRATAFVLSEALIAEMRAAGLDVVRDEGGAPDATALVVSGSFEAIEEGLRRHPARRPSEVVADAAIDYETTGAPARKLLALHLDSAALPGAGVPVADAKQDARRLGQRIGEAVVALMRRERWLAAAR
jgi:hypothetical protein